MWKLYDVTLLVIVSFKSYVMNFVDFVIFFYSHIISHVSQAFASCIHYTSYSLLNIVYVFVCVFRSDQPSLQILWVLMQNRYDAWEFMENVWNFNFGKTGFKTVVFKKTFHHILMRFVHQFQCFEVFLKCVFDFFKTVFFLKNFMCLYLLRLIQSFFRSIKIAFKIFMKSLSVLINRNCCFDQLNFKNKVFKKFKFDLFKPLFQKLFKTFSLSPTRQGSTTNFLSFSS